MFGASWHTGQQSKIGGRVKRAKAPCTIVPFPKIRHTGTSCKTTQRYLPPFDPVQQRNSSTLEPTLRAMPDLLECPNKCLQPVGGGGGLKPPEIRRGGVGKRIPRAALLFPRLVWNTLWNWSWSGMQFTLAGTDVRGENILRSVVASHVHDAMQAHHMWL